MHILEVLDDDLGRITFSQIQVNARMLTRIYQSRLSPLSVEDHRPSGDVDAAQNRQHRRVRNRLRRNPNWRPCVRQDFD